MFLSINLTAQRFCPQANIAGNNAIHKDSSIFIDWAKEVKIIRGYTNISHPELGYATFGTANMAIGKANGNPDVVSLGDKGEAVLTFNFPIVNGDGPDFAIFENGFIKNDTSEFAFLEFAFVEVSSDGINYLRFPAISEQAAEIQVNVFENINARYVHNLAGKYIMFYGTPFDLEELKTINNNIIDLNKITHIKIIDVCGSINPDYASYDALGNVINEPYPTPFESSGFDLDAVGVINNTQNTKQNNEKDVFPSPCTNELNIKNFKENKNISIFSISGKLISEFSTSGNKIETNYLLPGTYIIKAVSNNDIFISKFVKI